MTTQFARAFYSTAYNKDCMGFSAFAPQLPFENDVNTIIRKVFIILGEQTNQSSLCPGLEKEFPYVTDIVHYITDTKEAFRELPKRAFINVLYSLVFGAINALEVTPSVATKNLNTNKCLNLIAELTYLNMELAMAHLPEVWKILNLNVECATASTGLSHALFTASMITRNFLCTAPMNWQTIGNFFATTDQYLGKDRHKLGNLFGHLVRCNDNVTPVHNYLPAWGLAIAKWHQTQYLLQRAHFTDWEESWERHNDWYGKGTSIVYEHDGMMRAPLRLVDEWEMMMEF